MTWHWGHTEWGLSAAELLDGQKRCVCVAGRCEIAVASSLPGQEWIDLWLLHKASKTDIPEDILRSYGT